MNAYKEPTINDRVIQKAAQDKSAYNELMALFEQCERDNIAEFNRRADAHVKILAAIKAANFYPVKVVRYMQQQYPDKPAALGKKKKKAQAKIEAERERVKKNAQQRVYRQRVKERTEAAIIALTEHGYVLNEDFYMFDARRFLDSVAVTVEVGEGSENFEYYVRPKVAVPEGSDS